MAERRYADHDYEGAMADCHAAVDALARCAMRNHDAKAAWWLCANHAARLNCYNTPDRVMLMGLAQNEGNPPKSGTWREWFARPAVAATHSVTL